jgi:membrane fusion protein, multidrug efflux system
MKDSDQPTTHPKSAAHASHGSHSGHDAHRSQGSHASHEPHRSHGGPGSRAAQGQRPARKHRLLIVIVVLAVVLAAWLILGRSKPKPTPPPPAIPVSAEAVKLGNIDIYLDALGTVTPVNTVTVTSRVEGALTEVAYEEGQMVKKNDLLAVIDPRPYEAVVLQAQGQLARDQASLKNARLDLGRYQSAYQEHAVPEQQLATQQALVEQDEGAVKLDQGNLEAAQVNLDYTRIVSPIDGRVGLRQVDSGNNVTANGTTALATVTQLQPITVIFNLAEDDLAEVAAQIATGRVLPVEALDRTQQHKLAQGDLITIDNQINLTTGTVRARASFPNTRNELFPNQFVNARLLVKTLTKVDLVPSAAIQRNNDAAFVYVVPNTNLAQSRNVKIVATEGDEVAVTGVTPGEKVVTDGFDKLQNGTKVVIKQARAAAPANQTE